MDDCFILKMELKFRILFNGFFGKINMVVVWMINYPNRKMAKQSEILYGNRGMSFEKEINDSNDYYRVHDIALIYKKPTPLQIVKVDYPSRSHAVVREAYFQAPSTTDYNGVYRGKYIDFEAKEISNKTAFPLRNIHAHQIEHLKKVIDHGGIGFVLIKFTTLDKIFLLDGRILYDIYKQARKGGRKSISLKFLLEHGHLVEDKIVYTVDYLKTVDRVYFHET